VERRQTMPRTVGEPSIGHAALLWCMTHQPLP
jgi:hypothetical protein